MMSATESQSVRATSVNRPDEMLQQSPSPPTHSAPPTPSTGVVAPAEFETGEPKQASVEQISPAKTPKKDDFYSPQSRWGRTLGGMTAHQVSVGNVYLKTDRALTQLQKDAFAECVKQAREFAGEEASEENVIGWTVQAWNNRHQWR